MKYTLEIDSGGVSYINCPGMKRHRIQGENAKFILRGFTMAVIEERKHYRKKIKK